MKDLDATLADAALIGASARAARAASRALRARSHIAVLQGREAVEKARGHLRELRQIG